MFNVLRDKKWGGLADIVLVILIWNFSLLLTHSDLATNLAVLAF